MRSKLGVGEHDLMPLSVGELNVNKNHQVVIKALAELKDQHLHYMIAAGQGNQMEPLRNFAKMLGISSQIHLLGYRSDVTQLYQSAYIFCFPSLREGIGVAAMEAMSSGLSLITSNVHGITDYSIDGVSGYKYNRQDVKGFAKGILMLKDLRSRAMLGANNKNAVKRFSKEESQRRMKRIYEDITT